MTENLTDNLPGPAGRRVSPGAGPAQSAYLQGSRLRLLFVALMAGVLAYTFASSIVAPALPFIQHRLGSSVSATAFVLTAFLLTASVASPIMGGLADMYGKKQMFLIALYGLAAGLLVCALGAHSIGWLIAGRTLQGISIGAVTVAFAIVREEFPAEKAPGAMGAVSAGFGIGSGAGVVAAGLIIDAWGYTWIFWTGLVVTAVCVLAGHAWVPRSRQKHPSRIDVAGALLLAGWLAALLLALGQGDAWGWGSPALTVTVVVAVVLFVGWVVYGFRASEPMVDMRILTGRTVLLTNIASIMTGFGLFASFELVPQMVEAPPGAGYGFGASVTAAGLFLVPQSIVMIFSGPIGGRLGARYGAKLPLALGCLVGVAAFVLLALRHDDRLPVYVASGLLGLALGFAFAAMPHLISEAVPVAKTGVSIGMNFVFRTVGSALGAQIVATILTARHGEGSAGPAESAFVAAFLVAAAALAISFLATLAIPGRRAEAPTPSA